MIQPATLEHLASIMEIIQLTIAEMRSYNNTQWDNTYPTAKDFIEDIQNGDLFVDISDADAQLRGLICVNTLEPDEYAGLPWSTAGVAYVVHRMAVHPAYRRQGVGGGLLEFAQALAARNQIYYLKTDTYSINTKMNALFQKFGFSFVSEMAYRDKELPFYCYEKFSESR
jgi:GNAT superfamily N-acetyltransferase